MGKSIQISNGFCIETLLHRKSEVLASDSVSGEIAGTKNTGGFSQIRDFRDGFYRGHF